MSNKASFSYCHGLVMIVMFQDSPSFFHQSSPTGRPILFIAEGKRYWRPLFQGPGCLLCNYAQPSLFFGSQSCASTVPGSCFDFHASVLQYSKQRVGSNTQKEQHNKTLEKVLAGFCFAILAGGFFSSWVSRHTTTAASGYLF